VKKEKLKNRIDKLMK